MFKFVGMNEMKWKCSGSKP